MSFAQDNGYTPRTISEIMEQLRLNLNATFNLNYDSITFLGTNWYKFLFAAAQEMEQNEVVTSEIFAKLSDYIRFTNERIQRPSVSFPGLIDSFESRGYVASVKPPLEIDAGKISIAVDLDEDDPDFATKKIEIANLIKEFVAAGMVSQGDQVENITLPNGQNFDFKFFLVEKTPILLRLTLEISDNNLMQVPDDETIRIQLFEQINARYRMGWDFEPERYYNTTDAPWAAEVELEYSIDGGSNWLSEVYQADFRDLFTFGLEDIAVLING